MRALTVGLVVMSAWACGPDLERADDLSADELESSNDALKRRRPRPLPVDAGSTADAGSSTPVVDAGVGAPDAGTSPPPLTAVETHNLLVAYDIRVDVAVTYLTAEAAVSFSPVATSSSRVFVINGVRYFHANTLFRDPVTGARGVREIWASPELNQYYVQNNGVKGPVALGVSGSGLFWPDDFTIEKLHQFSITAELG